VTDKLSDLYSACNVTAIAGLLGKMGQLIYAFGMTQFEHFPYSL